MKNCFYEMVGELKCALSIMKRGKVYLFLYICCIYVLSFMQDH